MYDSEESINYNLLFCHACLSSSRTLHSVGEYLDIYRKICDNSRMNLTSQVNICWECMALLKKVQAFKRKVENAQKILDYCVNKQVPLEDNLSSLTVSNTEITTVGYILEDVNDYEKKLDKEDQLMFKIENVRGRCDILDMKSPLDVSMGSCDMSVKMDSPTEEERRYLRWKRSALLVYKRICSHLYAAHFLRPVSDDRAPQYSRIVRRPTDLSAIKRRINEGVIRTTAELTRALLLMFSNALMYNSCHHKIYKMALEFREETLRELSVLQAAHVEAEWPGPPAWGLRRRPAPAPAPSRMNTPPAQARRGAPAATKAPQATVRRRMSMSETSHEVAQTRRGAPAATKAPQATVRRRMSMWETSHEVAQTRRSAPAAGKVPQATVRRRMSVWDASHEDEIKGAVAPRSRRRASLSPEPSAEPPRRRKWDWPCLDNDQYLVANCFKKYKSTVLL